MLSSATHLKSRDVIATGVQVLERLVVHWVIGELHVLVHGVVNLPGDVTVEFLAEGLEVALVGLVGLVDSFFASPLHGETGDVGRDQRLWQLLVSKRLKVD